VYFQTADDVVESDELFKFARITPMHIDSRFHVAQLQWLGFNKQHAENVTYIKEFVATVVPK
jgi:hypothetical protein